MFSHNLMVKVMMMMMMVMMMMMMTMMMMMVMMVMMIIGYLLNEHLPLLLITVFTSYITKPFANKRNL
uniref:NADH dehydrogenase subunit 4L n=1 Tax=Angiostrongylus cantonensis TaxID=6313 RepID=A0A0K0DR28_ANGCA